ncbi:AraC family transcriptional regulator, partial [Streptomyces sp.]|uniref:AraC family transcriptional regulator n=1 Tax=Streptomyces sp. TaxID=1931 RepID=UPI002F42DBBD
DGRQAVLHPGDLAFYDTRRPYTLLFENGVATHFFRVPLAALALPDAALREVTARPLGADGTVSGLTSAFLSQLAASPGLQAGAAARTLAAPTVELVRAAVATEADQAALAAQPLQQTLGLRIIEYMRAHLADPRLSPEQVARAHHISVRYLYAILAREDIGFGDWVRTHRLDECRRELSRTPPSTRSVAAIATRWGFKSPSHFSRAFKSVYGMPPQAWREFAQSSPASSPLRPGP